MGYKCALKVENVNIGKKYGGAATAAFKSRTNRQSIPVGNTRVPSPSKLF